MRSLVLLPISFAWAYRPTVPPSGRAVACARALPVSLSVDESDTDSTTPPSGLHPGVVCDVTLSPISGYRYKRVGSSPSYDLCQPEFDKLTPEERRQFERIAPPLTPRRFVIGSVAAAAAAASLSALAPSQQQEDLEEDFLELPPLSPAEEIVAFFFKPKVPATQREVSPSAPLRPIVPAASAAECDEACKQRIADRRALFEQSRTTRDRQTILNLSRQRAALYNTTFQGASCIPGLPCI
jgi:hypothetical protein